MPTSPYAPSTIVAHNGLPIMGGGELWTARMMRGLAARGHRTLVLCRDDAMRERFEAEGVSASVQHLGGAAWLPDAVSMARTLRQLRPDAFLLTTFKKIWLGGMASSWAGVPRTVARVGLATDLPRRSALYRVALRRWVDVLVTNAESIRDEAAADLPGFESSRIRTIHNGVRVPCPVREARQVREELELPEGARVVLTLARTVGPKRLDRAIEALAGLPDHVHWVQAGHGPLRGALADLAHETGVADRVHLLGHRDDVDDLIGAADLYLVTSDVEGMSNAMLEAMAYGVPVVSTPTSGAAEALSAGPDGVAPGRVTGWEPDRIAEAVRQVLGDAMARSAMGEAARTRARQRFGFEQSVTLWERLLLDESIGL